MRKLDGKRLTQGNLFINILIRKGTNGHGPIPPIGRHWKLFVCFFVPRIFHAILNVRQACETRRLILICKKFYRPSCYFYCKIHLTDIETINRNRILSLRFYTLKHLQVSHVAAQEVICCCSRSDIFCGARSDIICCCSRSDIFYGTRSDIIFAAQEVTCCGARSDIICCCSRSDICCCSRSDMLLLKKWYILRRKKWQVATQYMFSFRFRPRDVFSLTGYTWE